ncbi:hypothetical protein FF80_02622 [Devosia sp. LC5]|nr:hypothetical protein FF80_02622 [Devosia sp. LC5]
MDLIALNAAIVAAKQACYVGGGEKSASSREGSHDLVWSQGPWRYRDSYFGGTDFWGAGLTGNTWISPKAQSVCSPARRPFIALEQRLTGCVIAAA